MFLLSIRTKRNQQKETGAVSTASSSQAAQGGSAKTNESYSRGLLKNTID
jgi:hypothetical protein